MTVIVASPHRHPRNSGNAPRRHTTLGRRVVRLAALLFLLIPVCVLAQDAKSSESAKYKCPEKATLTELLTAESGNHFDCAYLLGAKLVHDTASANDQAKKQEQKSTLDHLKKLSLLERSELLATGENYDAAVANLDVLLAKDTAVDSVADFVLLRRAETLRQQYLPDTSAAKAWSERITQAQALVQHGLTAKALDLFAADPFKDPTKAPTQKLRADAMKVILEAKRASAEDEASSVAQAWTERITQAQALVQRGLTATALDLFAADPFKDPAKAPTPELRAEATKIILDAKRASAEGEAWSAILSQIFIAVRKVADEIAIGSAALLLIVVLVLIVGFVLVPLWRMTRGGPKRLKEFWKKLRSGERKNGRWQWWRSCYLQYYPPRRIPLVIADLSNAEATSSKPEAAPGTLGKRVSHAVAAISHGHFHGSEESEIGLGSGGGIEAGVVVESSPVEQTTPLSASDIKLGYLTIKLDPLIKWLRRFYGRVRYSIRYDGTLRAVTDGGSSGYDLFVTKTVGVAPTYFHAYRGCPQPAKNDKPAPTADEPAAIDRATLDNTIDDMATAIAIDLAGENTVTKSVPSLRHYLIGMDLLERQIVSGHRNNNELNQAITSFWTALGHDPDNWLARYYLAYALRRRGKYLDAAGQFDQLHQMCQAEKDAVGFKHMKRYSHNAVHKDQPTVQRLVTWQACYSRACSYDRDQLKDALAKATWEISTLARTASAAKAIVKLSWLYKLARLMANVRLLELETITGKSEQHWSSFELALITEETEHWQSTEIGVMAKNRDQWQSVEEAWQPFLSANDANSRPSRDVCSSAYAAYGRAQYLHDPKDAGRKGGPINRLWLAVNEQPGFRDPEPYISLAQIYIEQQRFVWYEWADKAANCLAQALDIEPDNERAHYWRARLNVELGDFSAGLAELDRAGTNTNALSLRARINLNRYASASGAQSPTETGAPAEPREFGATMLARAAKLARGDDSAKALESECLDALNRFSKVIPTDSSKLTAKDRERITNLCNAIRAFPPGIPRDGQLKNKLEDLWKQLQTAAMQTIGTSANPQETPALKPKPETVEPS